jgi:hypothetical protein
VVDFKWSETQRGSELNTMAVGKTRQSVWNITSSLVVRHNPLSSVTCPPVLQPAQVR